jgi:hypothetical protein
VFAICFADISAIIFTNTYRKDKYNNTVQHYIQILYNNVQDPNINVLIPFLLGALFGGLLLLEGTEKYNKIFVIH